VAADRRGRVRLRPLPPQVRRRQVPEPRLAPSVRARAPVSGQQAPRPPPVAVAAPECLAPAVVRVPAERPCSPASDPSPAQAWTSTHTLR
jgi:hypothetical protein